MRRGVMVWGVAACLSAGAGGATGQVTLRGGAVLEDTVVGVSGQGVVSSPRLNSGARRVIPWDMVRSVEGEFADEAAAFAERADAAWRARTRLARGDDRLAEPALAALYAELKGEDGPLTLRVAEGLLRCRLIRGDQAGAVAVWLTALRLRGADAGLPAESGRGGGESGAFAGVIDPETGLCPALPPVWVDAGEAAALATELLGSGAVGAPGEAGTLAGWYARAATLEAGNDASGVVPAALEGKESEGVKLVALMVRSRDPDAAARKSARERLAGGLDDDADTWREAWRRAALGRSLLMESDAGARSEGVVHLLHLPARFARVQPYLTGVAVVEASNELRRRGDKASLAAATRLVAELKMDEPFHPALRAAGSGAGGVNGVRP